MKNLKKYLIFALCIALAFSALAVLTGCSNEAAEEESGAAEQQSDAGTPEEQIAALITAYFDGINEGDRTKLAPGLPKSIPLTMGEDYDTMLKELLNEEQDRVKTVAGKGGKVTCAVNAVTAITDDSVALTEKSAQLLLEAIRENESTAQFPVTLHMENNGSGWVITDSSVLTDALFGGMSAAALQFESSGDNGT